MYPIFPTYPNTFPTQTNAFPTQINVGPTQPTQIQYVNGKQSAETYQMAPNSSIILMDSNSPRFYMKQTDASGTATIKSYDFVEAEDDKPVEYVTKQEFEKYKASMKGVKRNESVDDAVRK